MCTIQKNLLDPMDCHARYTVYLENRAKGPGQVMFSGKKKTADKFLNYKMIVLHCKLHCVSIFRIIRFFASGVISFPLQPFWE